MTISIILKALMILGLIIFIVSHVHLLSVISRINPLGGVISAIFPIFMFLYIKELSKQSHISTYCWLGSIITMIIISVSYLLLENKLIQLG